MFYFDLSEDDRQLMTQGQTPFTFALEDREFTDEADARARLSGEVAAAAYWLEVCGVAGVRTDAARGRLWTDYDESGKAYMSLLDRYRVVRERDKALNLVLPR